MRNLLISLVLVAAAAAALLFWMQMPRGDETFVVLGVSETLHAEAAPPQPAGQGVRTSRIATNAEVDATGTAPVEGRYAVSTFSSDDDGTIRTRRIRFAPGPYTAVGQDVLRREIRDGFGRPALDYALRIEGALSEDGTQYAFYLLPTSHGRGDESTVTAGLDYDASSRLLELTIDECLQGETRRFHVVFRVAPDGTLTRHRE